MTDRVFAGAIIKDVETHPEAEPQGLKHDGIRQSAKAVLSIIKDGLLQDGMVRIHNFGTFRLRMSKPRNATNLHTGEAMRIPARARVVFSPAKALRDRIEPVHPRPQPLEEVESHAAVAPLPIVDAVASTAVPLPTAIESPLRESETASSSTTGSHQGMEEGVTDAQTSEVFNGIEEVASPFDSTLDESLAPFESEQIETTEFEQPATDNQSPPRKAWMVMASAAVLAMLAIILTHLMSEQPLTENAPMTTPVAQAPASEESVQIALAPSPQATEVSAHTDTDAQVKSDVKSESVVAASELIEASHSEVEPAIVSTKTAAPVEVAAPATPFFTARDHTLARGDSLWRLAGRNYIHAIYWPHIFNANQEQINNPHRLYQGRQLALPAFLGHPDDPDASDLRSIAEGYLLMYRYMISENDPDAFFALRAVASFDPAVIEENRQEIERDFKPSLKIIFRDLDKTRVARVTRSGIPLF